MSMCCENFIYIMVSEQKLQLSDVKSVILQLNDLYFCDWLQISLYQTVQMSAIYFIPLPRNLVFQTHSRGVFCDLWKHNILRVTG